MRKLTKQQKILFEILKDYPDGLTLGDIRHKFYKVHTPRINTQFHCDMKRNSRMSRWLNELWGNGFIYINRCEYNLYSLTEDAILILSK